jgi:hypothetical protein
MKSLLTARQSPQKTRSSFLVRKSYDAAALLSALDSHPDSRQHGSERWLWSVLSREQVRELIGVSSAGGAPGSREEGARSRDSADAFELIGDVTFGNDQVVRALQVHPESGV